MSVLNRGLQCRQAVELVTDYLEDRLSGRQRRRFEEHLAQCPGCAEYLQQIRTSIAALQRVESEALSPAAQTELIGLFERYSQSE